MASTANGALLGLFRDPEGAAKALDGLRSVGLSKNAKVLTDTPYPDGAFGEEPENHKLYVFPFIGAMCGFSVGLLLNIGTQIWQPVPGLWRTFLTSITASNNCGTSWSDSRNVWLRRRPCWRGISD